MADARSKRFFFFEFYLGVLEDELSFGTRPHSCRSPSGHYLNLVAHVKNTLADIAITKTMSFMLKFTAFTDCNDL
jgi:hypothetical protein